MEQKHGGNLFAASEAYQYSGEFLDFSANINPHGVPESVLSAIQSAISSGALLHYPDPNCTLLRRSLAARHGVSEDEILCGNGLSELFNIALQALPKGDVAIPAPSFREYELTAAQFGHTPRFIRLEQENWAVPLCDRRYTGAILANPNNPTSRALSKETLVSYLEGCSWVMLDEAFIELCVPGRAKSFLPLLSQHPNLIVFRAFTKSLAIPGLRLGYAVAGPELIAAIKRAQIPWSVNALAQSVAHALDGLSDYEAATSAWLSEEPERFCRELTQIPGLTAWRPDANFILCKSPMDSRELNGVLARRGILIRPAGNFVSLDDTFFRAAVRLRDENERLARELKKAVQWRH